MPEREEKPRNMKEMTLLEHLIELRDRLKVCLITVGVLTMIMLVFPAQLNLGWEALYAYKPMVSLVLDILREAVLPEGMRLIGLTITGPLELYFTASLIFALAFSSPVIGYEIFKYVDPALYPHERRMIYPFMAAFLGLFTGGLLFGLYIITPATFKAMVIFFTFVGAEPIIHIKDFYNTILIVTLGTGIVFTSPVILVLLVRAGIISTEAVTKNRKWIYGAAYIVAAIITPDGGVFTNLILLGVFVALIEGAVIVARRYEKKRELEEMGGSAEEVEQPAPKPGVDVCKFCGKPLNGKIFCPWCGRSQR